MTRPQRITAILLTLALLAVVLFAGLLWLTRAATVVDRSGQVASASVVHSAGRDPLLRLWSGYSVALWDRRANWRSSA